MNLNLLTSFENLTHATNFISSLAAVVESVGSNYIKDQNIRNALIDSSIAYLETLKTSTAGS